MDEELHRTTERLYAVFERYPLRPSTEPCLHCHDPEEELVLHEHLLRELTADQLSTFASEAPLVWGNEVDYKHFLPRILEIAVTRGDHDWGPPDWPDLETVFSRLAYTGWRRWPDDERAAIADFLRSFWRARLGRYPAAHEIGTMLTAFAATLTDLRPFLDAWLELPGEPPIRHLVEFVQMHASPLLMRGRLPNAFWSADEQEAAASLRAWTLSGRPRDRLSEAFFTAASGELEREISDAVRVLEALEAALA